MPHQHNSKKPKKSTFVIDLLVDLECGFQRKVRDERTLERVLNLHWKGGCEICREFYENKNNFIRRLMSREVTTTFTNRQNCKKATTMRKSAMGVGDCKDE